jgi:hypothetical protein
VTLNLTRSKPDSLNAPCQSRLLVIGLLVNCREVFWPLNACVLTTTDACEVLLSNCDVTLCYHCANQFEQLTPYLGGVQLTMLLHLRTPLRAAECSFNCDPTLNSVYKVAYVSKNHKTEKRRDDKSPQIHILGTKSSASLKDLAGIAQSVQRRVTDWTAGIRFPTEAKGFSLFHRVKTGCEAKPVSYPKKYRGRFTRGQSGRGAKHRLQQFPCLQPVRVSPYRC